MNNSSLTSADGSTHLKVVVVSLLAAILVVGVGILAKPNFSDGNSLFRSALRRFRTGDPRRKADRDRGRRPDYSLVLLTLNLPFPQGSTLSVAPPPPKGAQLFLRGGSSHANSVRALRMTD